MHHCTDIVIYHDSKTTKLKYILKKYKEEYALLHDKEQKYKKKIATFESAFQLSVGEIILEVLHLHNKNRRCLKHIYIKRLKRYEKQKNRCSKLKSRKKVWQFILMHLDDFTYSYEEVSKQIKRADNKYKKSKKRLSHTLKRVKEIEKELSKEKNDTSNRYTFRFQHTHQKNIKTQKIKLTESEQKEIKRLFRKAAKLCHPDIVATHLKDEAHTMIQALNIAYTKHDIQGVKKILNDLENSLSFSTKEYKTNERDLLEEEIERYQQRILEVKQRITTLKKSKTYQILSTITSWEAYFEKRRIEYKLRKKKLLKLNNCDDIINQT